MSNVDSNTTKGILLMVLSMAGFAAADTLVKLVSVEVSISHTVLLLVGGTALVFSLIAKVQGAAFVDRRALSPILLIRYIAEITGTFGLVVALASVPLSTVGAIIQATPLVVTLGAVVFLREHVSLQQWLAIGVGFLGVLMVIQPTAAGFEPSVLWAVAAMIGLSARDLTTRVTPPGMPSALLAAYTMLAALPFAILWCFLGEASVLPPTAPWLYVIGMVGLGALAYLLLIASIRSAPVSVVTPFRYSRLIFLMGFGMVVFGERPDIWIVLGAALIVGSGIYTMWLGRR